MCNASFRGSTQGNQARFVLGLLPDTKRAADHASQTIASEAAPRQASPTWRPRCDDTASASRCCCFATATALPQQLAGLNSQLSGRVVPTRTAVSDIQRPELDKWRNYEALRPASGEKLSFFAKRTARRRRLAEVATRFQKRNPTGRNRRRAWPPARNRTSLILLKMSATRRQRRGRAARASARRCPRSDR